MVRLKEICDVDWGNTNLTKKAYIDNGKYLGVSAGGCDGRMNYYDFDAYTPVISAIGANCGKMFLPEEPFVAIKNTITLNPHNNISGKYIFYAMSNNHIPHRGGGQPFISKSDTEEYMIHCPSFEEQQKIVVIFDNVSNLITERKKQLIKLNELVKYRFVEMFGDIMNTPKYSGISLGTICSTLSGGTPTTKVPEYYQGDIPWISTPYLGNNHIDGSSAKAYITEDAIKNSSTHLIPANTIMFGIRVGVGKSSIIDEPMCANQDIVALMGIDTNKYNLLFVKHTLDSYQSHFDSIKKGATILGITTDDLKKVLIPNVDIGLQNQFATFVEQTDKSKFEVQQSLEKLETLKKSLMQQYFG